MEKTLPKEICDVFDNLIDKYGETVFADTFSEYAVMKKLKNPIDCLYNSCRLNPDAANELNNLINALESPSKNTKDKGNKLEDLVAFIFENLSIFEVFKNKRSSTNEIDLIIRLTQEGFMVKHYGLFPFDDIYIFNVECKNYEDKIDVTWLGKFYSLLSTCSQKFGLIFSKKGFSARGKWADAKGLAKKILLKDGIYILDINLKHLKDLANGKNFLDIIRDEKDALDLDINSDFDKVSPHPLESDSDFLSDFTN